MTTSNQFFAASSAESDGLVAFPGALSGDDGYPDTQPLDLSELLGHHKGDALDTDSPSLA